MGGRTTHARISAADYMLVPRTASTTQRIRNSRDRLCLVTTRGGAKELLVGASGYRFEGLGRRPLRSLCAEKPLLQESLPPLAETHAGQHSPRCLSRCRNFQSTSSEQRRAVPMNQFVRQRTSVETSRQRSQATRNLYTSGKRDKRAGIGKRSHGW